MHAARQWQKGITDTLIIFQLHSFVMGERHVLNTFVLQAVDMTLNKFPVANEAINISLLNINIDCYYMVVHFTFVKRKGNCKLL